MSRAEDQLDSEVESESEAAKLKQTQKNALEVLPAGEKPTCPECSKSYVNAYSFKRHALAAHPDRNWDSYEFPNTRTVCKYCGK
jgi:hypothetical protein